MPGFTVFEAVLQPACFVESTALLGAEAFSMLVDLDSVFEHFMEG